MTLNLRSPWQGPVPRPVTAPTNEAGAQAPLILQLDSAARAADSAGLWDATFDLAALRTYLRPDRQYTLRLLAFAMTPRTRIPLKLMAPDLQDAPLAVLAAASRRTPPGGSLADGAAIMQALSAHSLRGAVAACGRLRLRLDSLIPGAGTKHPPAAMTGVTTVFPGAGAYTVSSPANWINLGQPSGAWNAFRYSMTNTRTSGGYYVYGAPNYPTRGEQVRTYPVEDGPNPPTQVLGAYLDLDAPFSFFLDTYDIGVSSGAHFAVQDWVVLGRDAPGRPWTRLHAVAGADLYTSVIRRYTLAPATPYRHYRIVFTKVGNTTSTESARSEALCSYLAYAGRPVRDPATRWTARLAVTEELPDA